MSKKQQVIQLVGIRQDDKRFYLTEEGKYFLQNINGPISVISIAGLYRTGKSFLVNQLLQKMSKNSQNQKHKFQVGSTVQSCTKGLIVWGVPFQSTNSNKRFSYIIVDSEGIGSMEQQYTYDMNLLMLIFLISSTVIYNSIGAIDEQSLDQLRVIVNLKKSFSTGQLNHQPRFIWVLRDFALQLINKKGHSLTSNQYLEDCLQCTSSTNKQVLKKNEIREAIKSCLPNRQCMTFVRPTIKQEELENLHSLPKNKLRHQFTQKIDELFQTVFRNQQEDIKLLNDAKNTVDGPTLCQMIEYYLNQINCNKIPEIKSVWQLIQSTKFDEIFQQIENQFKRQAMKINLSEKQTESDIKLKLNQILQFLLEKYEKQLPQGDIKVQKKLFLELNKSKQKVFNKILKASRQSRKKKALKFVRDHVNKHIQFDKIDPCGITEVKQIIQALKLKQIAQPQVYDYVLTTIFDILQIAQEKTIRIKTDLFQWQQSKKETQMQKNQKDEQLIKLKQSYHESLKEISSLKSSLVDDKQNLQFIRQQFKGMQQKCRILTKQKLQKQQELRMKIEELNEKIKRKHEQTAQSMKFLRTENQSLIQELQQAKKQLNDYHAGKRKQFIFEDKIKQSWDRFQEQRTYFKKELLKFKQLYHENEQKVRTLREKEEKLENMLRKERDIYAKKERQFCEQLKWMKENYSKTKEAYNQSMNTRIQSERILQDVTAKKKNTNAILLNQSRANNSMISINENLYNNDTKMSNMVDKSVLDELTLLCEQLKKEKQILLKEKLSFEKDNAKLNKEITALIKRFEAQQKSLKQTKLSYQQKISSLEQHRKLLQSSNETQKQRFYTCLKQLQDSKQQQRKMYEESIMRLLNNIEGMESSRIKPKFSVEKKSTTLGQSHKLSKKYLY